MEKQASCDALAPILSVVEFPLAGDEGSRGATRSAIKKAQSAIELAEGQLACLDLVSFFEAHPRVASASFDGEWDSDDEGGSRFYANVRLGLRELGEDEEDDEDDDDEDLGYELCEVVREWGQKLQGKKLSWSGDGGGVEAIGKVLLGARAYGEWAAGRERVELDRVAARARVESPEAMRL